MKYPIVLAIIWIFGFSLACNEQADQRVNAVTRGDTNDGIPNTVDVEEPINPHIQAMLQAGVVTATLTPGQELTVAQGLTSQDGRFMAIFQADGNFVLYYKTRALWASGTGGQASVRVIFQDDGNLVMYDANNNPLWASNTGGFGGTAASLTNEGALEVYGPDKKILWTTGTCCFPPATATDVRPIAIGKWGPKLTWPLIAIHSVLLPNSKVFTFGTDAKGVQGAQLIYDVWDPALGNVSTAHATLPNTTKTDAFCAAPVVMPQTGDVLIPGGDQRVPVEKVNTGIKDTLLFTTQTQNLARSYDLTFARWYETAITLANGEIMVTGGIDGDAQVSITPEIYRVGSGWRSLLGAANAEVFNRAEDRWFYPRQWVAPNGRVFGMTGDKMYFLDTAGIGRVTILPEAVPVFSRSRLSSAVMYQPGKIIQMGGNVPGSVSNRGSDGAFEVDINPAIPVTKKLNPMAYERIWVSATVLPNGEVFVNGGGTYENQLESAALVAEMWNPLTQKFRPLGATPIARLYHSTSLLLADGTVLVAGGGAPGPLLNLNAEIYYPPYLYDANGNFAKRPVINAGPNTGAYATVGAWTYTSANPITRVTLVKSGNVTHSSNMEQRFMDLPFTVQGTTINVTMPKHSGLATPGYYLLHFIDSKGVPSKAKVIGLGTGLNRTDTLLAMASLLPGKSISSADKNSKLTFKADGNIVLTYKGQQLWETATAGKNATRMTMQGDGNLVMYTAANAPVWASGTGGGANAGGRLVLGDDGNLRLQKGTEPFYWQSKTCCHNRVRDTLFPGDEIAINEALVSPDFRTEMRMQVDGNLVLFHQGAISWSTNTGGTDAVKAVMEANGILTLYNSANVVRWTSNAATAQTAGGYLLIQNDGNATLSNYNGMYWQSNTCCKFIVRTTLNPGESLSRGDRLDSTDKRSMLIMQDDGNLVLYHKGVAIWASNTGRKPAVEAVMQADGSLVLYSETKQVIWTTNTAAPANAGGKLVLQNDANLVMAVGNAFPYWASNTGGR